MMKDIYILGAGGFAKEVHFLIRQIGGYTIRAFVNREPLPPIRVGNTDYPVITDAQLNGAKSSLLAIGVGDPKLIARLTQQFGSFDFPNLIHPGVVADWPNIRLGKGNIISSGVNFTTDIIIGSFNVFNLACTVGHDAVIGNCNVFNPGANISGGVRAGNNNLVGTNATLLQYTSIGNNAVVGAASLVNKPVEDNTTVVGVPAKPLIK